MGDAKVLLLVVTKCILISPITLVMAVALVMLHVHFCQPDLLETIAAFLKKLSMRRVMWVTTNFKMNAACALHQATSTMFLLI